jgi:hypothetical protein
LRRKIMSKLAKCTTTILLILLSSTILLALSPNALAQVDDAQVILSATTGGTTNPAPGTYNYPNGTAIILTATPSEGYTFQYWSISGGYNPGHNQVPIILPNDFIDPDTGQLMEAYFASLPLQGSTLATYDSLTATQNPLAVLCGFGYTFSYQAVFAPTTPAVKVEATVVVKSAAGGSTNPGIGTYTFVDGSKITLTATANSGYVFQYWIASGTGTSGHEGILIKDNPLTITCGAGYSYDYQPVFAPEGAVTTTTGIPAEYFYAAVIILVILVAAGFGLALMFRRKK